MIDSIREHLLTSADVKRQFAEGHAERVAEAAGLLIESLGSGGKVMLCGNGGSAADCQHIAAEYVSRLSSEFPRRSLPALALTVDSSFLTAHANDYGFEDVFARQVSGLGAKGDVLIGISTSGNSANVAAAFETARAQGIKTIALTGVSGGALEPLADCLLAVPSTVTQHIQECHIAIGHLLVALSEREAVARLPS